MSNTCLIVKIEGRVQGVCFRHYAREEALRLGISGWVRNCADGSVEALICGSNIELMLEWLRQGPPSADVASLSSTPIDVDLEPASFEIRY